MGLFCPCMTHPESYFWDFFAGIKARPYSVLHIEVPGLSGGSGSGGGGDGGISTGSAPSDTGLGSTLGSEVMLSLLGNILWSIDL